MKQYSNTLLPVINKETIKSLTAITKETLDVVKKDERRFTPADYWNIQKQRRVFTSGRFLNNF